MVEVKFFEYKEVKDEVLKFAVIVARYKDKWVFCKHRKRATYECPGGHREAGESIISAAERELYEETGALEYCLEPICVYSVFKKDEENEKQKGYNNKQSYGMLFYTEIMRFGKLPEMEIEKIELFRKLPDNWTYPYIQPYLLKKVQELKGITL